MAANMDKCAFCTEEFPVSSLRFVRNFDVPVGKPGAHIYGCKDCREKYKAGLINAPATPDA